MTSQLTERDRRLVEAGHLPIDVDPARPVTELDRAQMSPEMYKRMREVEASGFVPMIHRGVLVYHKL